MKITHSAITSPVFELVKTIEVDLTLDDDLSPTRFEIFRDTERPDFFRCRVWHLEHFRIQSTFPQKDGTPVDDPSDEELMVGWGGPHVGFYDDFVAADADAALKKVIDDFRKFLAHTTLEEST